MKISEDLGGSCDRAPVDEGFRATFDRLCEQGCPAVLAASHQQDAPPADGGRWGLSVVATFDDQTQQQLASWAEEIRLLAGDRHWLTGAYGSAHVTVRAIQPHRPDLDSHDPFAARCVRAVTRAAGCLDRPVVFRLRGLALSPACVMACLYPVDATAGTLAAAVRREFGADGWLEESYSRTIWYSSVQHFTSSIDDPHALVRWVRARRGVKAGDALATRLQLATFRHDRARMVPVVLGQTRLPDSRVAAGGGA